MKQSRSNLMRVLTDQTVAVLIDVQEKLVPHMFGANEMLGRQQILLKGLRVLGVPILLTEQYPRGLGTTLPQLKDCLETYRPIQKTAFSCWDDPAFREALKESGRRTAILFGIESHVCVLQTVLDLGDQQYRPVVIEDCISSRNPSDKQIALRRIEQTGAVISSAESILFELCRVSGTEAFKRISQLVR